MPSPTTGCLHGRKALLEPLNNRCKVREMSALIIMAQGEADTAFIPLIFLILTVLTKANFSHLSYAIEESADAV